MRVLMLVIMVMRVLVGMCSLRTAARQSHSSLSSQSGSNPCLPESVCVCRVFPMR